MKCSGEQPCHACIKHNWECIFGHTGRRRYSEACVLGHFAALANTNRYFRQVKQLLDKIRNYEERLASQSDGESNIRNTRVHSACNSAGPSLSSPSAPDTIPSRPLRQREHATPGNPTSPGNHVPDDQPSEVLSYDDSVVGISPGKY